LAATVSASNIAVSAFEFRYGSYELGVDGGKIKDPGKCETIQREL